MPTDEKLPTGGKMAARENAEPLGDLFRMPVRHYMIAQLYGPGMPPSGEEGLHERTIEEPKHRIGLVLVHCWNLGEPNGPYPFEPGVRLPGQAGDWVPVAHGIVKNKIRPVLEAARKAGVAIFHLAQPVYAPRYPQYRRVAEDPELKEPAPTAVEGCIRPRSVQERWREEYGAAFPGPVWETHVKLFDIAEPVKPIPDEDVATTGWQLNGLCRRRDIDTLIYAGFMADLCLVNVPGAIREMANRFGYRCIALRDCTTAYEFADTKDGSWMNLAAVRLIETDLGYSASSEDFIAACSLLSGDS